MMYKRFLSLDLPEKQSAFLWGARKTGKSTYLKSTFPKSIYYDLLKTDLFLKFSKEPYLFREEVLALPDADLSNPIIVDEVQKIPSLLNEIHWLMENSEASFLLCGSSARKLRSTGVNLLGGRAWRSSFYPLTSHEITDFDLLKALNHGTIPTHYLSKNIKKSLKAYIQDYLTEEIRAEGLVRNLPAFARFLDSLGFSNGQMTNYANISRECGVDAKTVKEYYQILIDTLLGYYVFPYREKSARKDLIQATPKFYLFDVGVAQGLSHSTLPQLKGEAAGAAFEQFILLELMAYSGLNDLDIKISYWRTKTGYEVDFILNDAQIAIEVKISDSIRKNHIKPLLAFSKEYKPQKSIIVSLDARPRKMIEDGVEIHILPYGVFLENLWSGKILS